MKTIDFTANEQSLTVDEVLEYASNTVNYIKCTFDLGEGWEDLDLTRAIFKNRKSIVAVVISDNECMVPPEVLKECGFVKVNLVGSVFEDEELKDRITTEPVVALAITKAALVDDGDVVTPSQFEQFVALVEEDVEKVEEAVETAIKVKNMTVEAETLGVGEDATVTKTETEDAYNLLFGIPQGPRGTAGPAGQDGKDGVDGKDGIDGKDGVDGHSPVITASKSGKTTTIYSDGTQIGAVNDGQDGVDGTDGHSPTITASKSGKTTTIYSDGTQIGVVNDGADGQDGTDGQDGYSPTAVVTKIGKITTITITDKNGTTTQTVSDGEDGDDYVLTAQDRQDIADIVIADLPTWTGGAY